MSVTFLISLLILSTPHVVQTHVQGSVEASLSKKLPQDGPALAAQIARLLKWKGDIIRNIHRGDDLRIIYSPGESPQLTALYYKGLQISIEAYLTDDGSGIKRFYEGNGTLVEPKLPHNPVPRYLQITDVVQKGRGKRTHHGVDFKAPAGTPIVLPFTGVVQRVNWMRRVNGNCIEVRYNDGKLGRFLHLKKIAKRVQKGRTLAAGAPLGTVGSTGRSGAPHLHYEIRSPSGKVVDPLKYHGTRTERLSPEQSALFSRLRRRSRTLLNLPPPS